MMLTGRTEISQNGIFFSSFDGKTNLTKNKFSSLRNEELFDLLSDSKNKTPRSRYGRRPPRTKEPKLKLTSPENSTTVNSLLQTTRNSIEDSASSAGRTALTS